MLFRKRRELLVVVGAVLMFVSFAAAGPRKTQRMVSGTWGGEHIIIEVSEGSASIEYDCARGTIDAPLTLDSKGHFSWRGYHIRERGGPVRRDQRPKGQPAIYEGEIRGKIMMLTVTLASSNESLGTFTLTHGDQGRVWKCK